MQPEKPRPLAGLAPNFHKARARRGGNMKRKAPKKPRLEWKLAFVENGKRRLALTEEEDRELDEIIREHDQGHLTALAFARLHKTKAASMAQDQDADVRKVGRLFSRTFSELEKMILDGRGYVHHLIELGMRFNDFFRDARKPVIDFAQKRAATERGLTPARKQKAAKEGSKRERRYQILKGILADVVGDKTRLDKGDGEKISQRVAHVIRRRKGVSKAEVEAKLKLFPRLPIPKQTLQYYIDRYRSEKL